MLALERDSADFAEAVQPREDEGEWVKVSSKRANLRFRAVVLGASAHELWRGRGEARPGAREGMGASAGADGSQFGWIYEKLVAPTDSPAAPVGYTASQETRGELVQVSDSAATVRSGPSGDAAMLFGFPRGRELRLLSREPGWGELKDVRSKQVGWIAESSLQEPGQQTATSSRQRNGRGAYADAQEAAEQGGRLPWDQDMGQRNWRDQPTKRRKFGSRRNGVFADTLRRAFGGL